jgi:hypothetical protein
MLERDGSVPGVLFLNIASMLWRVNHEAAAFIRRWIPVKENPTYQQQQNDT